MPKVVFMMPTFSAPSEVWMQRMLAALSGHLLAIACYEPPVSEHLGVRVIDLGSRRDPASLAAGRSQLLELLSAHPQAPVLAHYLPFALRYESLWESVPNPLWVHAHGYDLTPELLRPGPDGVPARFHPPTYTAEVCRLSHRARIFANSHRSADKLREMGVPAGRIVVKYLGVPVPESPPKRTPRPGSLDCLFLGRLVDFKGPLETLHSFELAAAQGLGGVLTIAGDGPLGADLAAAVARSAVRERVRVLGAVSPEQASALRRSHDVFVAHSQVGPTSGQEEALGVAYLEALADGLPVVSAAGGSLSEVVTPDCGLLTAPGDLDAQAKSLLNLAGDAALYRRLSAGAHTRARQHFSDTRERTELLRLLVGTNAP
jgi:glycosyltransferase involved in cell wall biosynthesis